MLKKYKQILGVSAFVFGLTSGLILWQAPSAFAGFVFSQNSSSVDKVVVYNFFASSTAPNSLPLNATTTSATSTNVVPAFDTNGQLDNGYAVIAGAKKVTFFFSRGDTTGKGNTGLSDFRIQVSKDGTEWLNYNGFATSSAPTANRLASTTISAATSTTALSMDLMYNTYFAARCIVVEVTDGESSCQARIEF